MNFVTIEDVQYAYAGGDNGLTVTTCDGCHGSPIDEMDATCNRCQRGGRPGSTQVKRANVYSASGTLRNS